MYTSNKIEQNINKRVTKNKRKIKFNVHFK